MNILWLRRSILDPTPISEIPEFPSPPIIQKSQNFQIPRSPNFPENENYEC